MKHTSFDCERTSPAFFGGEKNELEAGIDPPTRPAAPPQKKTTIGRRGQGSAKDAEINATNPKGPQKTPRSQLQQGPSNACLRRRRGKTSDEALEKMWSVSAAILRKRRRPREVQELGAP